MKAERPGPDIRELTAVGGSATLAATLTKVCQNECLHGPTADVSVPRQAVREGGLTTTFVGSPDTVIEQIQQCREEVGVGVLDFFGKEVLPHIRAL